MRPEGRLVVKWFHAEGSGSKGRPDDANAADVGVSHYAYALYDASLALPISSEERIVYDRTRGWVVNLCPMGHINRMEPNRVGLFTRTGRGRSPSIRAVR